MPPKIKLPRRRVARDGELNLESAAEERIDAITAEPLHETNYVEIMSPDGTLRLFYNTSTLIRIAGDKGGFMQPPHFREPMSRSLEEQIEKLEGRKFRFESKNEFLSGGGDDDGIGGGMNIYHRHVFFEQIMDEFYHLQQADVYVCPVCYDHYLTTRYIPALQNASGGGARVEYINNGNTPVVDPLDVVSYMHSGAISDDTAIGVPEHWDTPLAHIVFRRANAWKRHMSVHHAVHDVASRDYTLRDILCNYHSHYNQLHSEKYQQRLSKDGEAKKKIALTQQRYWSRNARYNCLRYNRIVDATEAAECHPEAVQETAFPGETIAHQMNPVLDEDSNFINDEDESESEYTSASTEDEEEEEDEEEVSRPPERRAAKKRARGNKGGSDSGSSSSSASSSSSSSDDESSTLDVDESSNDVSIQDSKVTRTKDLYRRGLLLEHKLDDRMSAEDRRFVIAASQKSVAPSQLYDPIIHRSARKGNDTDDNKAEIDWDTLGGTLKSVKEESCNKKLAATPSKDQAGAVVATPVRALLLDDDEDDL